MTKKQAKTADNSKGVATNPQVAPIKAVRKVVYLGTIPLTVYQLPDGNYILSGNGITGAVKERRQHMSDFLASESLQALSCKGWNMSDRNAKKPVPVLGKGNHINPVPMYVAIAYWSYCAQHKNPQNPLASALIQALATGHLLTLVDDAFGVQRTAEERQQAMFDMLHPDSAQKATMEARVKQLESLLEETNSRCEDLAQAAFTKDHEIADYERLYIKACDSEALLRSADRASFNKRLAGVLDVAQSNVLNLYPRSPEGSAVVHTVTAVATMSLTSTKSNGCSVPND